MSAVISMCIGGTGVKIGKACMELNAEEHGIGADGFLKDEEAARMAPVNHNILFREDSLGRWTPRTLLFDTESDAIDELLSSEIGQLVEPGQWLSGHESAVFGTRASTTIGKDVYNDELFRREAE